MAEGNGNGYGLWRAAATLLAGVAIGLVSFVFSEGRDHPSRAEITSLINEKTRAIQELADSKLNDTNRNLDSVVSDQREILRQLGGLRDDLNRTLGEMDGMSSGIRRPHAR